MSYAVEVVKKLQISCERVVKRKLREGGEYLGKFLEMVSEEKSGRSKSFCGAGKKSFWSGGGS
jgi:hypothetical protein